MAITLGNIKKDNFIISTSVSPVCTFSLAGNKIDYTQSQGTNRENYFNHVNCERKNGNSGGK